MFNNTCFNYNKIYDLNVLLIVMKTTEKRKYDFTSRSQNQRFFYFSDKKGIVKNFENQQFVVPWQMVETKKREIIID